MLAAKRTATFTESVIREMTRIANQHEAINLAQGFPDFPMPEPMKDAASAAIHGDINQYAVTWGSAALRNAIAGKYRRWYDMEVDPDREVIATLGSKEGLANLASAITSPGDVILVPNPSYPIHQFGFIIAEGSVRSVPVGCPCPSSSCRMGNGSPQKRCRLKSQSRSL